MSEEIDLQTQLNVALQVMTKEQHNIWALTMELIQKDCSLMEARKRIGDLEERVNELTGVFSDAQDEGK